MTKRELKKFQKRVNNMKEFLKIHDYEKYEDLCELENNSNNKNIDTRIYSEWVDINFNIDPKDELSLNVYSIFLDYPKDKLLPIFESHYNRNSKIKRKAS